jgi:hypothetical protein
MAYTVMWRSTVAMATDIAAMDILATDIAATDMVATDTAATMVILMVVITVEDTTAHTTGLITEAIMATHMVATTAGININEDSGLASNIKTEEECGPKRVEVEATTSMSPLLLSFNTNVALAYIQRR